MVDRTKRLNIRVADDEARMLHDIAEHEAISISDVVRLFIRRRHAELFGAPKPRKSRKKR